MFVSKVMELVRQLHLRKDALEAVDQFDIAIKQLVNLHKQLKRRGFSFDHSVTQMDVRQRVLITVFARHSDGTPVDRLELSFVVENDRVMTIGRFGNTLDTLARNVEIMDSTAFKRGRLI